MQLCKSCADLLRLNFLRRPDKLEVSHGMQLEQVKRKIPSVLFSWDTYSASREGRFELLVFSKGEELSGSLSSLCFNLVFFCFRLSAVMKCGMSCSLFEVVDGKGKPTSGSLAALVNKLERDRMVSQCVAFKSPQAGNLAG